MTALTADNGCYKRKDIHFMIQIIGKSSSNYDNKRYYWNLFINRPEDKIISNV